MQLSASCLHHDFYRDEEVMVRGNLFLIVVFFIHEAYCACNKSLYELYSIVL